MYQVRLSYQVRKLSTRRLEGLDRAIFIAAGRDSDFSGTTVVKPYVRDHGWNVESFEEAVRMRTRLEEIKGATVTIREA